LIGGSDDVQETLERIEALNDLDTQVADLEVAESRFDASDDQRPRSNDPHARQDLVAEIDDTMLRRDVMTNPMTFLQKPISREVLLRRVRDVLDAN
jgi:hypothetical protein